MPGTLVTVTAVPSVGYVFDIWSGETEGIADLHQNPASFLMGDELDNNRAMTANFIPSDVRYAVTAIVEPGGGGSVSLRPSQPAEGYRVNENVSVNARPSTGYVFSHWTGDLGGTENERTLLVSEDKSITAIFNPMVTTYCGPSEGGSVSLEPAQPTNGYTANTEVTITARAKNGYRFVAWQGDLSGSAQSVTITVDEPKTIAAKFAKESPFSWWLWVIVSLAGLFGVLILVRLVYARLNRSAWDEP